MPTKIDRFTKYDMIKSALIPNVNLPCHPDSNKAVNCFLYIFCLKNTYLLLHTYDNTYETVFMTRTSSIASTKKTRGLKDPVCRSAYSKYEQRSLLGAKYDGYHVFWYQARLSWFYHSLFAIKNCRKGDTFWLYWEQARKWEEQHDVILLQWI